MSVRKQLAYLAAALTLGLGLLGLLNPLLTVRLLGLEVLQPRGLSEARAVFGALFLVMGVSMLWSITSRNASPVYLRLPGLLVASMALGRLLSILIDGVLSPLNFVFLAVEVLIGSAAIVASLPRAGEPHHPPSARSGEGGADLSRSRRPR